MERLIRRRRECPELGWGEWSLLPQDEPAVLAHRADWEGSTIVAVHNLGGRAAQARLALGEEGVLVDLLGGDDVDGGGDRCSRSSRTATAGSGCGGRASASRPSGRDLWRRRSRSSAKRCVS